MNVVRLCVTALELKLFLKSTSFTKNKGGLKEPCINTVLLMFNCELVYRKYKTHFLHNSNCNIVDKISNNIKINYPLCEKYWNVKPKLIKHYFTIGSYATYNLCVCKKRKRYTEQQQKR